MPEPALHPARHADRHALAARRRKCRALYRCVPVGELLGDRGVVADACARAAPAAARRAIGCETITRCAARRSARVRPSTNVTIACSTSVRRVEIALVHAQLVAARSSPSRCGCASAGTRAMRREPELAQPRQQLVGVARRASRRSRARAATASRRAARSRRRQRAKHFTGPGTKSRVVGGPDERGHFDLRPA